MKKKEQSLFIQILKFIGYTVIGIVILIFLFFYAQTEHAKELNKYDYAIIIGFALFVLTVKKLDDIEKRLDRLEDGDDY
jgi:flagellar basal body-associated protein FliL